METVLIDLGMERGAPEVPSLLSRWRHRARCPGLRQVAAPVVALALASLIVPGLTASAPRQPWVTQGYTLPDDEDSAFALGRDTVYTTRRNGDQLLLGAYRLTDGRLGWEREVLRGAVADGYTGVQLVGSIVLVSALEVTNRASPEVTTVAHDAGTGQRLWSAPVNVYPVGPGGQGDPFVAERQLPEPCQAASGPAQYLDCPRELSGIDLTTGRPLWTAQVRGAATAASAPGGQGAVRVAHLDRERLEVRDVATGAVVASRPTPRSDLPLALWSAADVLIATPNEPAAGTATAYDSATLAERWSVTVGSESSIWPCGLAVICDQSPTATRVLDAATGRQLWTAWGNSVNELSPGLFLVGTFDGGSDAWLVDGQTGLRLYPLGGWSPVHWRPSGENILVARQDPAQRIWFGVLRLRRGEVVPLGGAAPGRWRHCHPMDNRRLQPGDTAAVACVPQGGGLTVFRIRVPA